MEELPSKEYLVTQLAHQGKVCRAADETETLSYEVYLSAKRHREFCDAVYKAIREDLDKVSTAYQGKSDNKGGNND